MVDLPQEPNGRAKSGEVPGQASTAGMPRWVKVSGLIALIVVLLFVIMLLVPGEHGPGRHLGGQGPVIGVTEIAGPDVRSIG